MYRSYCDRWDKWGNEELVTAVPVITQNARNHVSGRLDLVVFALFVLFVRICFV
jgi:hypothetical protein